ncbi:peptidoglycan recognition protein family protein [Flavobacterium cerinum]|uniref:N-acetylmuramoyl-L-alanine amidase n=1 Tax=Flavobacterium cerinum TaxID=2502784 RepID=A0A444H0C7_9FLAO|nr:peptidoglycan recognition family protein [Flavobacterium cerinum]RWW96701.1 N-acetylmuramoyl-L-alanine amidase [Flavobacterium cerinum]
MPYHFAIDGNGNIYEGRPIDIVGSHVKGANTGNIGIVLMADLDSQNTGLGKIQGFVENVLGDGSASSQMIESLVNLTRYLNSTYGIKYFGGHQEAIPNRYCPGDMGMEWVQRIRNTYKFSKPIEKQ